MLLEPLVGPWPNARGWEWQGAPCTHCWQPLTTTGRGSGQATGLSTSPAVILHGAVSPTDFNAPAGPARSLPDLLPPAPGPYPLTASHLDTKKLHYSHTQSRTVSLLIPHWALVPPLTDEETGTQGTHPNHPLGLEP